MSEFEMWLRDHLDEAVPPDLDSSGLLVGARRYARRSRRIQVAVVAAVVAAAVGVGGAVASGEIRGRALTPAHPVSHLACGQSPSARAASATDRSQPLSTHLREVLVCADRSAQSAWQGFLPQDEPVSFPASLDYLSLAATQSQRCPAMPGGPSYRFLLLDEAGQVAALDNRSLACNGWPALNRYFIALGDQMSSERHAQLADPFPSCPSMLHLQLQGTSSGPAALAKGTVFTQATLCWHPLADPSALPAHSAVPVSREVLSAAKLAVLNATVARQGSVKGRVTCAHDPAWVVALHAVTTTGRQVSLIGPCLNSNLVYVNGAQDDTITFPQAVVNALTQ